MVGWRCGLGLVQLTVVALVVAETVPVVRRLGAAGREVGLLLKELGGDLDRGGFFVGCVSHRCIPTSRWSQ